MPPHNFAWNLCRKYNITLRKTMELSDARAEVTIEMYKEWVKKMEIIFAKPEIAAILNAPNAASRIFNNVRTFALRVSLSDKFIELKC